MKTQLTLLLLLFSCALFAQDTLYLANPSFEGNPDIGHDNWLSIQGWLNCGQEKYTAPDVQPNEDSENGFFGVTKAAHDGKTYLSMVAREDNSWEFISQDLKTPLKAGHTYRFSIHLAQSDHFQSPGPNDTNYRPLDFDKPVSLRIWGSNGRCKKRERLATSPPIDNKEWENYEFEFRPTGDWDWIILEVFYKTPTLKPYNGHLLIDDCSPIVEVIPLKN